MYVYMHKPMLHAHIYIHVCILGENNAAERKAKKLAENTFIIVCINMDNMLCDIDCCALARSHVVS